MWTGSVSPYIRPKAKGARPKRNMERRAARRHTLPGYPVEAGQMSKEEIDAYFGGDKITCLMCGKSYRSLGLHLPRIHGMTADDYRQRFGLPWRRGLTSATSNAAYSAPSRKRHEENPKHLMTVCEKGRRSANMAPRRQRFRVHNDASLENIANATPKGFYPEGVFDEFVARVASGRTVKDVATDGDMPSRSWLHEQCSDPAKKKRMREAVDCLSYTLQAENQMGFSAKFVKDIRLMRSRGLSDHSIAAALGVTAMTINKHRHRAGIK